MNKLKEIKALEILIDSELHRPRFNKPISKKLLEYRDSWASIILQAALESENYLITEGEEKKGFELIQNPVFICGTPRSGTTMLHDLFDGHPNLCVLPSEGNFYNFLNPKLTDSKADEKLLLTVKEWLLKFVIQLGQEPYWILGRSTEGYSPYVEFVRYMLPWWKITQKSFEGMDIQPLLAVVLAYASYRGEGVINETNLYWVEKTPDNEFNIRKLRRYFPKAKFIILVRNPFKVYASRKKAEEVILGYFINRYTTITNLVKSHHIAAKLFNKDKRIFIVQYERLVDFQALLCQQICRFLGISVHECLVEQTIAGLITSPNSSYTIDPSSSNKQIKESYQKSLRKQDKKLISALTRKTSKVFGYQTMPLSRITENYYKVSFYMTGFMIKIKRKIKKWIVKF